MKASDAHTKEEHFIFSPGIWIGEGTISLLAVRQLIKFYTRWNIQEEQLGILIATQVVETEGVEEHLINQWTFQKNEPLHFSVTLESASVGKITGTGRYEPRIISWEFIGNESDESVKGFERYDYQESGFYFLQAKYGAAAPYCTIIDGRLWQKS